MTESQWNINVAKPAAMLRKVSGRVSPRKLQLLTAAACRLVWDQITRDEHRLYIKTLELYADRLIGEREYDEIRNQVIDSVDGDETDPAFAALSSAVYHDVARGAELCVAWVVECAERAANDKQHLVRGTMRARVCDLIREVIGDPYRPWSVMPAFLGGGLVQPDGVTAQLSETASRIAESIQSEQAFDRMPILADSLEESGITDRTILEHCRTDAPHVRGCWALDVVLGK